MWCCGGPTPPPPRPSRTALAAVPHHAHPEGRPPLPHHVLRHRHPPVLLPAVGVPPEPGVDFGALSWRMGQRVRTKIG